MKKVKSRATDPTVRTFRAAAAKAAAEPYELCLFIAGTTPLSAAALGTVSAVCDAHLKGRYDLIVVDVYQEPDRARADQIIAVPTLLKRRPLPVRRIIGDLSDYAELLVGLGLPAHPSPSHEDEP